MNKGGFPIIGIGVFIFLGGYMTEDKAIMFLGAIILMLGFGGLAVKTSNGKNPATGQEYFKCPNCGRNAGEEIPKERREDGKIYKCKICNYKW